MADYLLDNNHLSAALRKVSPLRERIHRSRRSGHRFIACYPVICELEVGIQQTARPDEYRRRLARLLGSIRLWPLDQETARYYGGVYLELRKLGRALSQVPHRHFLARGRGSVSKNPGFSAMCSSSASFIRPPAFWT
jgi:predicted nucleic acid-binding protein